MPLSNRDFLDEERHHQAIALHRPSSADGTGAADLYYDYQQHRPHISDQLSRNSLWNNCTDAVQSGGQDSLLGMARVNFERFVTSSQHLISSCPAATATAAGAASTGLYHDYQQYHPQHNSHQSSCNAIWNNCTETLQSDGQGSMLGLNRLDLQRLCRGQMISRRTSLQNFMHFSPKSSDQSIQANAGIISEVLGDLESLFDDDEAPSSQRVQLVASRILVNQGQQQIRADVNPSLKQAWQWEPAVSDMRTSTRNLSSSLATMKQVATVRTNSQEHQDVLAGKKCLKRTGLELDNYSPFSKNAPCDSSAALMTETAFPVSKKPRHCTPVDDDSKSEGESLPEDRRFRSYQAERWAESFAELSVFRKKQGNCQVPHSYPTSPALARWVKRQRYQYKLKKDGNISTMTDERVEQLETIGFVWDSHSSAWVERFNELRTFREKVGHCNVPSHYAECPPLATWVKCQRRQYKLFWQGKTSNINLHRIKQLDDIGFEWVLQGRRGRKVPQQF